MIIVSASKASRFSSLGRYGINHWTVISEKDCTTREKLIPRYIFSFCFHTSNIILRVLVILKCVLSNSREVEKANK